MLKIIDNLPEYVFGLRATGDVSGDEIKNVLVSGLLLAKILFGFSIFCYYFCWFLAKMLCNFSRGEDEEG